MNTAKDEDEKTVKVLDEAGWTICSKFNCEECPIELNCPFDQLELSIHKVAPAHIF